MKKKVLATSLLTILLCVCLIAGSTYALFADDESMNITVTAGKLDIEAEINTTLKAWSLGQTENNAVSGTTVTFVNGGVAYLDSDGNLIIDRMTPGDTVQFTVNVTNNSNIIIDYLLKAQSTLVISAEEAAAGKKDLLDALTCTISGVNGDTNTTYTLDKNQKSFTSNYFEVGATDGVGAAISSFTVTLHFPNGDNDHDNSFQKASAKISFTVEAVQSNHEMAPVNP